jgi:predicted nucleic acid-binding protein
VVDANVLFSAAIKDRATASLLLGDDVSYHAPGYLFDEFREYRDELLAKTHRR